MSYYLQRKYATLLPLQQFELKHNGNYYANFRCCVCSDSKVSEQKKRGWFIVNEDGSLKYHCFNCGYDKPFSFFLKTHFPDYYKEYLKELYFDKQPEKKVTREEDIFKTNNDSLNLTKLSDLPSTHQAIKYVKNRKIPISLLQDCYYSDNFYDWCKERQPDTFNQEFSSDKRLIFPFKEKNGNIFGLSGRSIEFKEPKYLTLKFDNDYPKVFGYDRLDIHKTVYITEGQIDSLFVDNCIGVIGAMGSVDSVCEWGKLYNKDKIVLLTDNEPRNKETCKFIKKNLEKGYGVVLWPNKIRVKDINDMMDKLNLTREEIATIIKENTYRGTLGLLKFSSWKRC